MNTNQNTNQLTITRILMGVGVVFIVVALGVFITKNWNYLSDAFKNGMLLVVSGGFFFASYAFRVKKNLYSVASIFYYLATLFIGAFVVVAMGGIHPRQAELNSLLLMIADILIASLILIRVYLFKRISDVLMCVIALEPMAVLVGVYFNSLIAGMVVNAILFLGVSCLYAKLQNYQEYKLTVSVLMWIQLGLQMLTAFAQIFSMGYERKTDIAALVTASALLLGVTYAYMMTESDGMKKGLRVCQTFAICFAIIDATVFGFDFIGFVNDYKCVVDVDLVAVVAYFGMLLALVFMDRIEALIIAISISALANAFQVCANDYLYFPIITAICFGIMLIRQHFIYGKGAYDTLELNEYRGYACNFDVMDMIQYVGIILVIGLIYMFVGDCDDIGWGAVIFLGFAIFVASINLLIHNETAKKVIGTINIFNFATGIGAMDFVDDQYYIGGEYIYFEMEIYSTIFLASIGLLGLFWRESKGNMLKNLQFVLVAMVFLSDLAYNLEDGDIYTLLYLGVAAAITMIIGSVKGSKKYVVLSALT